MNRKTRKAAIPIVWLLFHVLTTPMPFASYVLCIGADGHIEFEAAVNGRCTDVQVNGWTQLKVQSTFVVPSGNHCDSCLDIPVFASNSDEQYVVPTKTPLTNLSVSTVAIITFQQPTSATIPTRSSRFDFPSRINPTLISLRTVTLLI